MNNSYTVTAKGRINAQSGNMMNTHYTTIETLTTPKHSWDLLSKIENTANIGDTIELDLNKVSGWDKHQLT